MSNIKKDINSRKNFLMLYAEKMKNLLVSWENKKFLYLEKAGKENKLYFAETFFR